MFSHACVCAIFHANALQCCFLCCKIKIYEKSMISERIKQEYQNYKTNGGYLYGSNDQGRGCVGRKSLLPPCPEPVKIIHPSAKKRKNVSERLWRNWGMSRISRQAILPLRIRVPLASFSPLPQKKSMRTPSIWKQSRNQPLL